MLVPFTQLLREGAFFERSQPVAICPDVIRLVQPQEVNGYGRPAVRLSVDGEPEPVLVDGTVESVLHSLGSADAACAMKIEAIRQILDS